MSKREFKEQCGYITFALGKKYLKLAYAQALSIKSTQNIKNYAVVIDKETEKSIDKYRHAFDEIIILDYQPTDWDMSQHWRVYSLTPWRETVLLDADIIFTSSVDHWWDAMRLREVCITRAIKDFREDTITSRRYRKLFDENLLPDVYAGFLYFRYTQFTMEFFALVKLISQNWDWISKEHLIKNEDHRIKLDEVFSIATRIFGIQNVTLPYSIPTFVHGKESLWKLNEQQPWYNQLFVEFNDNLIIGHYQQRLPLHYHHKEWVTNDIIQQLERNYKKSTNCID